VGYLPVERASQVQVFENAYRPKLRPTEWLSWSPDVSSRLVIDCIRKLYCFDRAISIANTVTELEIRSWLMSMCDFLLGFFSLLIRMSLVSQLMLTMENPQSNCGNWPS
jgi:hypothetical protein